ncbi:MAG: hypothetical protein KatS3mg119_1444 [Rhodothalassiaceae bacterium]|nr:MAG: hypothetical protein KatS3mg119_1444 [Rhodothalassiaceae bacterium]
MAAPGKEKLRQRGVLLVLAGGLWALAVAVLLHDRPAEADRARVLTRDDVISAVEQALARQDRRPGSTSDQLAMRRLLSGCQILLEERRPEPGTPEAEQDRIRMVGWLRC